MKQPKRPDLAPLVGLKGKEYRRAWNKLHQDILRESERRYRAAHPEAGKKLHRKYMRKYGVAYTTQRSRKTEQHAVKAWERWTSEADALLTSGLTESELSVRLGRSLRAIQRRKWRLRQNCGSQTPKVT